MKRTVLERVPKSPLADSFFAPAQTVSMTPLRYKAGKVTIKVSPSIDGLPTHYGKLILMFAASLVADAVVEGKPASPIVDFEAQDLFKAVCLRTDDCTLSQLDSELARLQGTKVDITKKYEGGVEDIGFSWILESNISYQIGNDGIERAGLIRVQLCSWLYQEVLSNPEAFASPGAVMFTPIPGRGRGDVYPYFDNHHLENRE